MSPSLEEMLKEFPTINSGAEKGSLDSLVGHEQAVLQYVKNHPKLADIQGNPKGVLAAIDEFATNEKFLMNIGSDKGRIVKDLIAQEKPKVLVELGGYVGYSAILFADQMTRTIGSRQDVKVLSLEYCQEFADVANELIAMAGLSDVITVVVGAAEESLRKLVESNQLDHIDFLFLDHIEALYEQDLQVCEDLGLLKPGACIVADNVLVPGAPDYRRHVRAHPRLRSWGVPGLIMPGDVQDELEVSKVL